MSSEPRDHSPISRPPSPTGVRQRITQALRGEKGGWVSSRVLVIGFGVGVALTLGAGFWLSQQASGEGEQKNQDGSKTPALAEAASGATKAVTVAPAQPAQVRQFLDATGTVEAQELVPVKSQATGLQVIRVLVGEGQTVQANQPMAILDDSVLRTQLLQARASVDEAQAALGELKRGTRVEVLNQAVDRINQAQAQLNQAAADVELAQERLKDNVSLEAEGAISNDRLIEVRTQAKRAVAARDQAQANLGEAKNRLEELKKGPRAESVAQARARLVRAQGQVQELGVRLRQARVVASASGVVAERRVKVGELISPDQELFSIIEGGAVELYLKVPETQIRRIRPGLPVRVTSDSDPSLRRVGQVREIDPVINPDSRQATVKVALQSSAGLRKGMFLRGEIATALNQGLAIPTAAVLPQGDGSAIVYQVAQDRTVTAVPITTGEMLPGAWVEVKTGLQPGDAVVVKGAPYLKDGDRVNITGTVTPPQTPRPAAKPTAAPAPNP